MTNTERIKALLVPMLSDIYTTDTEQTDIIKMVYEEIMFECKPYEKAYAFNIFEDQNIYDFESIATLSEQLEQGITGVDFPGDPDFEIQWQTTNIPSETIILTVDDIIDEKDFSVYKYFKEIYKNTYKVSNSEFLKMKNGEAFTFYCKICPEIDAVPAKIFSSLVPSIIHGVKFYVYNTPQTRELDQGNNLMAMRYFKAKEELTNQFLSKNNYKEERPRWL